MLTFGIPLEVSLVGAFDDTGRGSRRDIDLPLHRDGDYSPGFRGKIDIVGLYCIKPGIATTLVEYPGGRIESWVLEKNQAIIFDNKQCRHARYGPVGDRILLRVWISKKSSQKTLQ